jgi:uncharacterized protein YciW
VTVTKSDLSDLLAAVQASELTEKIRTSLAAPASQVGQVRLAAAGYRYRARKSFREASNDLVTRAWGAKRSKAWYAPA